MDFDFNKILDSITGFFEYIFSGQIFIDVFFATISIGVGIVIFLINLFPPLPHLSENVYQNILTFFDFPFTSGAIGFIGWIFGGWSILTPVILTSFAVISFRILWDFRLFIITKLPIGVKR